MNWKKKLLMDASVFLLAGAVCQAVLGWRFGWVVSGPLFLVVAGWPFLLLFWLPSFIAIGWMRVFGRNPLLWLALAMALVWLLVRQFRRQDRLSLWLGATAVALWCVAGLVWTFFIVMEGW